MKKATRNCADMQAKKVGSLRVKPIVLQMVAALTALYGSVLCLAAPTGGQVVTAVGGGTPATIITKGNTTLIDQTGARAVINWNNFSVNSGETVNFKVPKEVVGAATLNRVTGTMPSSINGLVQGNGRVFLLNPNGILIGKDGQINVQGGFVGSTGNISDSAFMQGGAMLVSGGKGSIQVLGTINTPSGDITLVAPAVAVGAGATLQAGTQINLVAADQVTLSNGAITVTPSSASQSGTVSVAGTLQAAKVMLAAVNNNLGALAINTTGMIQATGTATNPDGSIQIVATGGGTAQIGGTVQAQNADGTGGTLQVSGENVNVSSAQINVSGTHGGAVTITAGPDAGTVMVDSSTVSASGSQGTGGQIDVTGWHTGLTGSTALNASGATGGGTIRVGGDMHGQGTDIANATGTYVGSGVTLNADGTQGNASGGKVVVWANDGTNYYGHLEATGSGTGHGGNAEVSGHNNLNFQGSTNLLGGVNGGAPGILLLDPSDLTIDATGAGTSTGYTGAPATASFNTGAGPTFTVAASHISWQDIVAALGTANVTIDTSTGGGGAGNITVAQGYTYNSGNALLMMAFNNLTVNSGAAVTNTGTGQIYLAAKKVMTINANLATGGNLALQAGAGIAVNTQQLSAGPNATLSLVGNYDPYGGTNGPGAQGPGLMAFNFTGSINGTLGNYAGIPTNYGYGPNQVTFASGTANPVILQGGNVGVQQGTIGGPTNFLPSSVVVEYGAGNTSFNNALFIGGFNNVEVERWNPGTGTVVPDITMNPLGASNNGIEFLAGGTLTVPTSLSVPNNESLILTTVNNNLILQGNSYSAGPTGQLAIGAGLGGWGGVNRNGSSYGGFGGVQFAGTAPTLLQGGSIYVSSNCNTTANCAVTDRTTWSPSLVLVHPNSGSGQFANLVVEGFQNTVVQDSAGPTTPILASNSIYEVSASNLTVTQNLIVGAGGVLYLDSGSPTNAGNYNGAGLTTFTQPNTILQADNIYLFSGTGTAVAGTIPTNSQAVWQGSVAATEAQLPSQGRVSFDTPTNGVQLRTGSASNVFNVLQTQGFDDLRIDLLQNGTTTPSNLLSVNAYLVLQASGNVVLPQGAGTTGVTQTLSSQGTSNTTYIQAGYDYATNSDDLFGVIKVLAPQPLWSLANSYTIQSGLGYNQTAGTVNRIDFAGGALGSATPTAEDSNASTNFTGKPIILQASAASGMFGNVAIGGFDNINLYAVSSATTPGSLSWAGNVLNGFTQTFPFSTYTSGYLQLFADNNLNLYNQYFQIGQPNNYTWVDAEAGYNGFNYDTAVKPGKLTFMDPTTLAARTNLAAFRPGGTDEYILVNNRGNDPGSANDLTNLTWDWTTGGINYVPMASFFRLNSFRNVTVQTVNNLPIVLQYYYWFFNNFVAVQISPYGNAVVPALEGDIKIVPNIYTNTSLDGTYYYNPYTIIGNSLNTLGILGMNVGTSAAVSGNDAAGGGNVNINLLHNAVLADGVTPGKTSSVINVSADTSSSSNDQTTEEWVNMNLTALTGNVTVNSRGMINMNSWGNTSDTSNITIRSQGDIGTGNVTRTGAGNISLQADANLNSIFSGYAAINPTYTGSNTDPRGYDTAGADGRGVVFGNSSVTALMPQFGAVWLVGASGYTQSAGTGHNLYTLTGTLIAPGTLISAGTAVIIDYQAGGAAGGGVWTGLSNLLSGGNQVYAIYGYNVTNGSGTGQAYTSLGTAVAVSGVTPQAVTSDAGIVTNVAGQSNPLGTIVPGNTGTKGLGLSGQFYTVQQGGNWSLPLAWQMQTQSPVSITTGTGNIDIRSGYMYQNDWGAHQAGDVGDLRLGSTVATNTGLNNPAAVATWLKLGSISGSIAVAGYRDITVSDTSAITPSAGTASVSLVANRDLDIIAGLSRATTGSLLTLGAGNMIVTSPGATINADQLQLIVGNGTDIVTSVNGLSGEIIAPATNLTGVLSVGGTYRGMSILGDTSTGVMSVTNGKTVSINSGFANGMLAAFSFGPQGLVWPAPAPFGSPVISPLNPIGLSVQSAGAALAGSINIGTTAGDINVNAPINVLSSPGITTGEVNLAAAGNIAINSSITDTAGTSNIFLQARNGNISHSGAAGTNTITGNNLTMSATGAIGATGSGNAIDTNVNDALFQSGTGAYVYQSGPLALTAAGTANGTVNVTDSQNTLTVGNFPTGTTPQTTLTAAVTNNVIAPGLTSEIGISTTGANNITLNAIGANSDVMAAAHTYTPGGTITVNAGRNILDTLEDANYGDIGVGTGTPTSNALAFSSGGMLTLTAANTIGGDGAATPNPLDVYFGNLTATANGTQALSGVYLTALDTNPAGGVVIGGAVSSAKNVDITARASTTAGSGSLNVAGAMTTANGGYIRLAADQNVNVNAAVSANTTGNVLLAAGLGGTGNINQGAAGAISSGSGEINAYATGNINWDANATTTGNILVQSGQAMTYGGAGALNAGAVALTSGTTIGTAGAAVQTNTNSLAVVNGGNAFVNNSGAVTLAAASSNNASINVSTTNGTMTVGSVNVATSVTPATGNDVGWDNNPGGTPIAAGANLVGVSANGSGNVNLMANGAGSNVLVDQSVTSGSGAIAATASNNVTFNNGVAQTGTGATGIVTLTAINGQVIDNEAASKAVVIGNTLNATAANGIGTVASGSGVAGDLATQVSTLAASITGTGNAVVQNSGALNVSGSVGTNTLNVGSTAGITVSGPIAAAGGTVDLTSGMSAVGTTGLSNNTGGVTLASDVTAGTLSINSAGLVQQTAGAIKDNTLQVDTTRFTTGNSATLSNDSSTLTENGSNVTGNYTIATGGTLNQSGTTTVGGNLTESGFTGGTVNGAVTVGGNYNGVNTYGAGGSITAAGANSWTNANAATTGVVMAAGAGPDFDLASANLGVGKVITVDLRSKTSTVSGNQDAILLNGTGSNELGAVSLKTGGKVTVATAQNDYNLVQTTPVNVASLTVNAVAGATAATLLQNNGIGVINGISYGTHNNNLNGGSGSRIALQSAGNTIGAVTINNADTAGVASDGNITVNNVTLNNGLSVSSSGGAILNGAGTAVQARTLDLSALKGIGTAAAPINYDTATVVAATGAPGILATDVTGVTGSTFVSATGALQLGGTVNDISFTCNGTSSNLCNPALTTTGTAVTPALKGNNSANGNITLVAAGPITTGNTVTTSGGNIAVSNTSGNITLSNAVMAGSTGAVELTSAADLLVNAAVSSTAGEINAKAANNVVLGASVTTAGNVFVQAASKAITQTAGTVSGAGAVLTAGTTIGTAGNRIQLNSSKLALQSAGSAYATEAGAVTVAGATTANGALDVQTTNGALTVGTVNLTPGIAGNAPGVALVVTFAASVAAPLERRLISPVSAALPPTVGDSSVPVLAVPDRFELARVKPTSLIVPPSCTAPVVDTAVLPLPLSLVASTGVAPAAIAAAVS